MATIVVAASSGNKEGPANYFRDPKKAITGYSSSWEVYLAHFMRTPSVHGIDIARACYQIVLVICVVNVRSPSIYWVITYLLSSLYSYMDVMLMVFICFFAGRFTAAQTYNTMTDIIRVKWALVRYRVYRVCKIYLKYTVDMFSTGLKRLRTYLTVNHISVLAIIVWKMYTADVVL